MYEYVKDTPAPAPVAELVTMSLERYTSMIQRIAELQALTSRSTANDNLVDVIEHLEAKCAASKDAETHTVHKDTLQDVGVDGISEISVVTKYNHLTDSFYNAITIQRPVYTHVQKLSR